MFIVLVTQLNSIYQALVVMSAIVFSIAGVLIGLLITGRPFGIVMGGLGVISLGGIVVNNNIVLIDTYKEMRGKGFDAAEAAIRTGAQSTAPVFTNARQASVCFYAGIENGAMCPTVKLGRLFDQTLQ